MKTPSNPFLITGYYSSSYFCDREEETERMVSALQNHRNLTLFALRRIGKTGLIHHVFKKLEKDPNTVVFYLDIMPTTNLKEFINRFSKAVLGKMDSTPEKVLKQVGSFFKKVRPVISIDEFTGQPEIEFSIENTKQAEETLEQIFLYLQKQHKRIYIAFDEFQQILHYPEKNVEALLRTQIQALKNVNFIFSGSHKHMLLSIFGDQKKPFYQSTEFMYLDKISPDKYLPFIRKHFKKGGISCTDELIVAIIVWTRNHTYYTQYTCNKLYSWNSKKLTPKELKERQAQLLKENEMLYYNYRNLLTKEQWRLLKAIAKEEVVEKPTGKKFIKKHDLNTTSTVQRSLKALLDKEMIYELNGGYYVYDVFLSRWLEQN